MVKNNELRTSCTSELNNKIEEFVKKRTYPSPDDPKILIKFKSKADLVLYVMRAIAKSNEIEWYLFVNWLNPNRRF